MPLSVLFLLNPQAWEKWKQGPLLPPQQSGVVEPTPVPHHPLSLLASALPCLSWLRAAQGCLKLIPSRQSQRNQDMGSERRGLTGASDGGMEVVAEKVNDRPG